MDRLVYLGPSFHSTPTAYSCHMKHIGISYKNSGLEAKGKWRIVNEKQKQDILCVKYIINSKVMETEEAVPRNGTSDNGC